MKKIFRLSASIFDAKREKEKTGNSSEMKLFFPISDILPQGIRLEEVLRTYLPV
jgi:hypothetical protein